MSIPFVPIDLTSVTGCVTDVSDIYAPNKDTTKAPAVYFHFIVHSKKKVVCAVCFSPQKPPFVMLLNWLKNEGIKIKKVRVSNSNDYLLYSFSQVSKVYLN